MQPRFPALPYLFPLESRNTPHHHLLPSVDPSSFPSRWIAGHARSLLRKGQCPVDSIFQNLSLDMNIKILIAKCSLASQKKEPMTSVSLSLHPVFCPEAVNSYLVLAPACLLFPALWSPRWIRKAPAEFPLKLLGTEIPQMLCKGQCPVDSVFFQNLSLDVNIEMLSAKCTDMNLWLMKYLILFVKSRKAV